MITGSLVALVTPMLANGELDWQSLHDLVEFHIEHGSDGLVLLGTTGESATLTEQERYEILSRVVKQVNRRLPVVAGTGSNSTRAAIHMTAEAKALGADACMLVTPSYNRPTQEGLYRHFQAVAAAVSIPLMLYNVPGRTTVDLLPETVARLADIPTIVAVKEATGDLERASTLLEMCGDRIALFSGDDASAVELMLMGGKGSVSVSANIAPKQIHTLCTLACGGEAEAARALNSTLMPLHRALFVESNPIPAKFALHAMGLIHNGIRLPLTPLTQSGEKAVTAALHDCALATAQLS